MREEVFAEGAPLQRDEVIGGVPGISFRICDGAGWLFAVCPMAEDPFIERVVRHVRSKAEDIRLQDEETAVFVTRPASRGFLLATLLFLVVPAFRLILKSLRKGVGFIGLRGESRG